MAYLDSKVPRSIPAGLAYFDYDNDGKMDLYVANNSQPNALYLNKGNGTFMDVTSAAGSNTAWFSNILAGSKRHDRELREDWSLADRLSPHSWVGCFPDISMPGTWSERQNHRNTMSISQAEGQCL